MRILRSKYRSEADYVLQTVFGCALETSGDGLLRVPDGTIERRAGAMRSIDVIHTTWYSMLPNPLRFFCFPPEIDCCLHRQVPGRAKDSARVSTGLPPAQAR